MVRGLAISAGKFQQSKAFGDMSGRWRDVVVMNLRLSKLEGLLPTSPLLEEDLSSMVLVTLDECYAEHCSRSFKRLKGPIRQACSNLVYMHVQLVQQSLENYSWAWVDLAFLVREG